MAERLTCYDCGKSYSSRGQKRCVCGEPLWFETPDAIDSLTDPTGQAMWEYSPVLPTSGPVGVGSAAGGTPLIRLSSLDSTAGCRIYVKDESENPTGSFKDRGSAVGISYAVDSSIKRVGTLSYGNMAMSVAANAASADLDCVVIVPSKIPDVRFELIGQYEPRIVQVDDFQQVNETLAAVESELDIELINADVPLRVAGQKTVSYEIADQHLPDAVVVPVASGGHASAIWQGFRELVEFDQIDDVPRLYLVQVEASEPIARAYREGNDKVDPVETLDTAAVSIVNKAPLSGNRALAAARQSGGAVLSVTEEETLEATATLASRGGLCVEPACAVTLAGASRLSERDEIGQEEDVVLVATGTGFKELAGEPPDPKVDDAEPENVRSYLDNLDTAL